MIVDLDQYLRELKPIFKPNTSNYTLQTYAQCMVYAEMPSKIDSDNLPDVWLDLQRKLDSGTSYGHIEGAVKIVRGALRYYGVQWVKERNFYTLMSDVAAKHRKVDPYSDDQMRAIFRAFATDRYTDLKNAVILCTYAGLRIGSVQPLKFSDFEKVPGYEVRVFPVKSKGIEYTAAISENAFSRLARFKYGTAEPLEHVSYRKDTKTPFEALMRTRLKAVLENASLYGIMENHSPWHSMRHFFGQKLASDGAIHAEEIALLMGHKMPNTTSYKIYIKREELVERIAKAYNASAMMKTDLFPTFEELQEIVTGLRSTAA